MTLRRCIWDAGLNIFVSFVNSLSVHLYHRSSSLILIIEALDDSDDASHLVLFESLSRPFLNLCFDRSLLANLAYLPHQALFSSIPVTGTSLDLSGCEFVQRSLSYGHEVRRFSHATQYSTCRLLIPAFPEALTVRYSSTRGATQIYGV